MPRHKSNEDSLERRVIETPSLSRADFGIVNEGFDSVSSPSFFYVEDSNSWVDPRRHDHKRFTESWIELDRAYSCGSSLESNKKCRSTCCCCCKITCAKVTRWLVYLLVALSVIGFAAIVSAILYMEIFHKFDYEWHPLRDTDVFAHHNHHHINESLLLPVSPVTQVYNVTTTASATSTTSSPIERVTSTIKSTGSGSSSSSSSISTLSKQLKVSSIVSSSTESSLASISSTVNVTRVPDTNVTSTSSPSLPVTSSSTRMKAGATSINTNSNTAGTTQILFNVTSAPKVVTNTPVNLTLF